MIIKWVHPGVGLIQNALVHSPNLDFGQLVRENFLWPLLVFDISPFGMNTTPLGWHDRKYLGPLSSCAYFAVKPRPTLPLFLRITQRCDVSRIQKMSTHAAVCIARCCIKEQAHSDSILIISIITGTSVRFPLTIASVLHLSLLSGQIVSTHHTVSLS